MSEHGKTKSAVRLSQREKGEEQFRQRNRICAELRRPTNYGPETQKICKETEEQAQIQQLPIDMEQLSGESCLVQLELTGLVVTLATLSK